MKTAITGVRKTSTSVRLTHEAYAIIKKLASDASIKAGRNISMNIAINTLILQAKDTELPDITEFLE